MKGKLLLLTGLFLADLLFCGKDPPVKPFVLSIAGKVTDSEGNPLSGASITTNPPSASVTTDSNGQFVVSVGVDVGEYTITATKEGYKPVSVTIKAVEARQNQRADVVLPKVVVGASPKIHVIPLNLDFGSESTSKAFGVSNTGLDTLRWKAVPNASWFSLTRSSDAVAIGTQVVGVQVNRQGMKADSYQGSIDINSNGGSETVKVLMVVPTSPKLSVTPASLAFDANKSSLTLDIVNVGTGTLTWRVSKNVPWISLSDTSGTTQTETDRISVTVNRTGLLPGKHQGTITVTSSSGAETIPVTASASEPAKLFVSFDNSLYFGSTTGMLYLVISNNGTEVLTWNITTSNNWISVSQNSGTTTTESDSVAVTVSRSGMATGNYEGNVSVTSNGGAVSKLVTMTVPSAPPPVQSGTSGGSVPGNVMPKADYEDSFIRVAIKSARVSRDTAYVSILYESISTGKVQIALGSPVRYGYSSDFTYLLDEYGEKWKLYKSYFIDLSSPSGWSGLRGHGLFDTIVPLTPDKSQVQVGFMFWTSRKSAGRLFTLYQHLRIESSGMPSIVQGIVISGLSAQ